MEKPDFNLLEEPWVLVVTPDCTVKEVSLTDALLHAHEFTDLAGELASQNVAVLRLLLAVLHTVFSRVDEKGEPAPFETEDDALGRWEALWKMKRFPEKPIVEYLQSQHERFWLFHPDRPFGQIAQIDKNRTKYKAKKLNGVISESDNKLRLFLAFCGEDKNRLTYAQAARWLLHTNGFDDSSPKPPRNANLPSPGIAWLGKLGIVEAVGDNLFETLMLNMVLLNDKGELWGANRPEWELPEPRCGERTKITLPDNQAEMLTMQSRRILLEKAGEYVTGFIDISGDFIDEELALTEQMTMWKATKETKFSKGQILPKKHDHSSHLWREFPSMFMRQAGQESAPLPGVVRWIELTQKANCLDEKRMISFRAVSVSYDSKNASITDVFSDELTFHTALLSDLGFEWQDRVSDEIGRCEKLAREIGWLVIQIKKAAGDETDAKKTDIGAAARGEFYSRLDAPFRRWLSELDPDAGTDAMPDKLCEWRTAAKRIAVSLGQELVDAAGEKAFVGRHITDKAGGKEKDYLYSAPKAFNWFLYKVNKIYE